MSGADWCRLCPLPGAEVKINGSLVTEATALSTGMILDLGEEHTFRFNDPEEARRKKAAKKKKKAAAAAEKVVACCFSCSKVVSERRTCTTSLNIHNR